jgi:RNA polymerase sigma-70 factor, ECF subfamily
LSILSRPAEELAAHCDDETAFAAAYERHYTAVYRYVLALTRSLDDADDVSAETFERAFASMQKEPSSLADVSLPWLLLTARRIATDRWRRARRLFEIHRKFRTEVQSSRELHETEFWMWFDAVSRALPARQREILILKYQRDLSETDIGSIMGLSSSGVRSLAARAIDTLRRHEDLLR